MLLPHTDIASIEIDPASFRDPSGFIFTFENEIYRAIAPSYFENFSTFIKYGLYSSLSSRNLITSHSETENFLPAEYSSYKIIKPEKIPFISYPYEWTFGQLKDVALLTLTILKESIKHGMILKDASAYNIQFIGAIPIFIDTLSFEKYREGSPWNAYRQFCQHFLAPLALMSYKSHELSKLLLNYIDGIPLELASSLLPRRAMLNSGVATHIFLHSKIQKKYSGSNVTKNTKANLSKSKLLTMIAHLEECIGGLKLKSKKSEWINYVLENTYSNDAIEQKEKIISGWLEKIKPQTILDLGCNTGKFSLLAAKYSGYVIAMDSDHYCIENIYSSLKSTGIKNILPLTMDLSSPSPAIGWANNERKTFFNRAKADTVLALALLHHLRIGNNVPMPLIAKFFSELSQNLIIEFIPEDDSRVMQMLSDRENIFNDYTYENFVSAFSSYFHLDEKHSIKDSGRILFLMTRK